ncbi:unnamed protein product [Closterium sp. NIES-53]
MEPPSHQLPAHPFHVCFALLHRLPWCHNSHFPSFILPTMLVVFVRVRMDRGIKGVKLQHRFSLSFALLLPLHCCLSSAASPLPPLLCRLSSAASPLHACRSSKVGGPVTLAIAARGGSGATNTAPPSATFATNSSPITADSANGIADSACRIADSTNGTADSSTDGVRVSVCPHFVLSGPCKGLSAADMWLHLEKVCFFSALERPSAAVTASLSPYLFLPTPPTTPTVPPFLSQTGTFPPHHESALSSHPSFPGMAIGAAVAASVLVPPGATRHVDFTLCWDVPVACFNPDSHYLRCDR